MDHVVSVLIGLLSWILLDLAVSKIVETEDISLLLMINVKIFRKAVNFSVSIIKYASSARVDLFISGMMEVARLLMATDIVLLLIVLVASVQVVTLELLLLTEYAAEKTKR